jgi:hypothetical protein
MIFTHGSHLAIPQHLLLVRLELCSLSLLQGTGQACNGVVVGAALQASSE